jgi:hypothetical protein
MTGAALLHFTLVTLKMSFQDTIELGNFRGGGHKLIRGFRMIVPTVLLAVLASSVWSQSIDLRTNARVTHPWMETGFVSVNDAEWVTVTSMGTEYVNPVVLTALPDLGGDLYTTGLATATRIRNLVNNAGQVTFDVKVWTLPLLSHLTPPSHFFSALPT